MDIQGKRVMIFGGWGLVGQAIARQILKERPTELILTSLREQEAREIQALLVNHPANQGTRISVDWGDLFVRVELADKPKRDIFKDRKLVQLLIHDIYDDLTEEIISSSKLVQVINRFKPQILIDCINTATAFAYQNIYQLVAELRTDLQQAREAQHVPQELLGKIENTMATLYIPQLIRHVQLLIEAMRRGKVEFYLKVGTTGTGGMGFNIPYTHSEDRPSKMLMSKSSLAGAHTMLLWLLGRTPNSPVVKELKPAAAIAWKKIGYGEVIRKGTTIPLYDCRPSEKTALGPTLSRSPKCSWERLEDRVLESVYIDAGENGYFSAGEFAVLTAEGQMEFITPEEIADNVLLEIKGGNTGHDIMAALDAAVLPPSYRGGLLRYAALQKMRQLEKEKDCDSVAFELLGPPRLTKLLYEAYMLKRLKGSLEAVIKARPSDLTREMEELILKDSALRSTILSVGTPILLSDGKNLLRGPDISIPNFEGRPVLEVTPENIDRWTAQGWLDLRRENMVTWQERFKRMQEMMSSETRMDYSSSYYRNRRFLAAVEEMDIGAVVNWVLEFEDKGYRIKY